MDPRVAMRVIPILLNHYPDRVAQVAILDSPWVFKAAWQLIKTVIDPLSQTKAIMLRGEEMHAYFQSFLTPDQRAFAAGMLQLRAAPKRERIFQNKYAQRKGERDARRTPLWPRILQRRRQNVHVERRSVDFAFSSHR